jgi:hypothetical protein
MSGKIELTVGLEVFCLSPFMVMPSGPGIGEFFADGSYKVRLHDGNIYEGAPKMPWSFGLIEGVDEEHLYLNIVPMVSAKVSEISQNNLVETWLHKHHQK